MRLGRGQPTASGPTRVLPGWSGEVVGRRSWAGTGGISCRMPFSSGQPPAAHPGPGAGSPAPSPLRKGAPAGPSSPGVPMARAQPPPALRSYLVGTVGPRRNTLALGVRCARGRRETRALRTGAPARAPRLMAFSSEGLGH